MAQKRLFISDVHLGAGRYSDESKGSDRHPHEWDWLSEGETENFKSFIKFLRTVYVDDIKEVILLGDIFDNWVFPHDLGPPTMDELITAPKNENVVRELNELSKNIPVYYIPGNHDMHATREIINAHFPKIIFCPEQFTAGRLIAEHGHRYAMFNAPPQFSDNLSGLPMGYFISRVEASKKAMTNREDRTYRTYVDDFIEMVGRPTLPQCVLEAVLEEAQLDEDIKYKVRKKDGNTTTISAVDVKETYKDIYDDWPTQKVSKHRAVFAELDMLGPIADKLCKNGTYKVCVFGHSHKSEIDKDTWFINDRIYANAGYWCGAKCTFVEVEKNGDNYEVGLIKWLGNDQIKRGKTYCV
ncbi:MAG: hypothetical protein GY846_09960 [Deltaproteobacteria bacterium]|nr:hypothetical protein [Deltaproteobacteria bacterium]